MGSSVIGKTNPNLKPNNSGSATRIIDKIPHEHVTRTDLDAIAPRHPPVTVDTCYMARALECRADYRAQLVRYSSNVTHSNDDSVNEADDHHHPMG
jgi:hypothetical protein